MTIKIKQCSGNLLHVKSGHIVHGCNNQGVMGSGVALGVKNSWPEVYRDYRNLYEHSELRLGIAYPVLASPGLIVWNAITQDKYGHGKRFTNYEAVATCFEMINEYLSHCLVNEPSIDIPNEVHIPMIGAARGGGSWRVIESIIEETMDFPVTLYLPDNTVTTL